MEKKLELWGAIATIAYLAVIGWWVSTKWASFLGLELNALGDFLAGTFGPIAFLWLVLGFLQQGRELRMSSQALQLQAQELSNSVEQQAIIAKATLEQLEEQRRVNLIQIEERDKLYSANFTIKVVDTRVDEYMTVAQVQIVNSGEIAHEVNYWFDPPLHEPSRGAVSFISKDSEVVMEARYEGGESPRSGMCQLNYLDGGGKSRSDIFFYEISIRDDQLNFTKVTSPSMKATMGVHGSRPTPWNG